jgi:hypothetical protein
VRLQKLIFSESRYSPPCMEYDGQLMCSQERSTASYWETYESTPCFQFSGVGWDWVHTAYGPLFGLLYQPRMIDDERGTVGGMRIGRGNGSTRSKPAPVPLCPPQIPHYLNYDRTRAARGGKLGINRITLISILILSYNLYVHLESDSPLCDCPNNCMNFESPYIFSHVQLP